MGPETDLVSHCARQSPHCGFFASQLDHALLQAVDGLIACGVVHVILEGGFDHGLAGLALIHFMHTYIAGIGRILG